MSKLNYGKITSFTFQQRRIILNCEKAKVTIRVDKQDCFKPFKLNMNKGKLLQSIRQQYDVVKDPYFPQPLAKNICVVLTFRAKNTEITTLEIPIRTRYVNVSTGYSLFAVSINDCEYYAPQIVEKIIVLKSSSTKKIEFCNCPSCSDFDKEYDQSRNDCDGDCLDDDAYELDPDYTGYTDSYGSYANGYAAGYVDGANRTDGCE